MPATRSKACANCRRNKRRCSLEIPCYGCFQRGLECQYRGSHSENLSNGRLRPIQPRYQDCKAAQTPVDAIARQGLSEQQSTSSGSPTIQDIDLARVSASDTVSASQHAPETRNDGAIDFSFSDLISLSSPFSLCDLDFLPDVDPRSQVPHITSSQRQLSRRNRTLQQGSLTATLLSSRLNDFARMMADRKRLPPFIHPPCALDRIEDCVPNSHQCLPEILSACADLSQAFYAALPSEHGFVWQRIWKHLRRMRDEVKRTLPRDPCIVDE
jgi:hypothetical protein